MQAAELEKLVTKLGKWTLAHLNSLLDLLDISRGSGEEGLKVHMLSQTTWLLPCEVKSKSNPCSEGSLLIQFDLSTLWLVE